MKKDENKKPHIKILFQIYSKHTEKRSIVKNNYPPIVLLSILILIHLIKSCNNYFLFPKYFNSVIILKIKGTGPQKIISHEANAINISEIYLNDVKVESDIQNNYEIININTGYDINIIKIILDNFNGNLDNGFSGISNATEIDLSQLNTPLTLANNLFNHCISLVSINLSNLDTSQLTSMGHFFSGCHSLVSLDLSNFDTSNVIWIDNMFKDCYSLTSLNLQNFNINNSVVVDNMFQNCRSLTTLNLSNFIIKGNDIISGMFIGCWNLTYLNIKNFFIPEHPRHLVIENIIRNTTKNIVICLDINNQKEAYSMLDVDDQNCVNLDCSANWILNRKKIVDSDNSCIDNCSSVSQYEYEGKCYQTCPNGTFLNLLEQCEKEELIIENKTKTKICEIEKFFLGKCKNNFISKSDKGVFKNNIITAIKNGSLTNLLKVKINKGNNLIIGEGNEVYLISTLMNQMDLENLTSINFSECEKLLRGDSEDKNEEIYIFRIDHKIEGYIIPVIEYVIFYENGTFLNLDKCNNINSEFFIPVNINDQELFKHDPSSDYYNDECSKYKTENGIDMTIYDRKNDYNINNLSLCEANCTFIGYNSSTSKAECQCKTKSYFLSIDDLSQDNLLNKLDNEEKKTNLILMKCYNLISSEESIKSNTGFYLIGIIIILFIIVMILFCIKGYNSLENKIDEIIHIKFKKNEKSKSIIYHLKTQSRRPNKSNTKKQKHSLSSNSKNILMNKNNKTSRKKISVLTRSNKEDKNKAYKDFIKSTNDYELNNLSFEMALLYDKRSFCEYYCSLIRTKQLVFFSFCDFNDYNSGIIKKFIFFLSFALHYTVNALFFTDKTMHQIYQDEGKYNIIYQLPFCTYSAIISTIILRIILSTLVLTEKNVLEVKSQKSKNSAILKKKKILKCIIIKYAIFSILNLMLLITFWYYLTCFNALYENTQINLIINSVISFTISSIYPFLINIVPAFFRNDILYKRPIKKEKLKKNDLEDLKYIYKISKWLQLL